MPLNAVGWTTEADEELAELVEPHPHLYNVSDPSRKNILTRETTWHEIAKNLGKPVEEVKKRWRGLRDGYMRSKRMGSLHKTKLGVFEKLQFLDNYSMENGDEVEEIITTKEEVMDTENGEQQVITDNQEYYEITVVETPLPQIPPPEAKMQPKLIRILPKNPLVQQQQNLIKKVKNKPGRKKTISIPQSNNPPIKILPKPSVVVNEPQIMRYVEDHKTPDNRSPVIDSLIERMLKENTNEIDVFFRSMAQTVKKLQPNLIPKVKMEVCNVVAKYEMQSFEKSGNK